MVMHLTLKKEKHENNATQRYGLYFFTRQS